MAQIVTITNPLTGQPTQVDQLEHTAQQIDDGIGFDSTDYPGCYYRLVNGVVEWFNPPMVPEKEYRTTERYQAKPVYTKAIYFGPLANGATLATPHGIKDIDAVIYCGGTLDYQGRSMPYWFSTEDYAICKANRTDITTITAGGGWSTQNYTAIIKYTKTTDQ